MDFPAISTQALSTLSIQPQLPAPTMRTLRVEILSTRLLLLTFVAVAAIVCSVVFINRGVNLRTIEMQESGNATTLESYVDDYNSYSAYVMSAFGTPIEALVNTVVFVVALRFSTNLVLHPATSWRFGAFLYASFLALKYLVLNGMNALNVQPSQSHIHPVISDRDLSVVSAGGDSNIIGNVTTSLHTFSERAPKNLISNTVLRNVILPKVMKPGERNGQCSRGDALQGDDKLTYGFPTRTWQRSMLSSAIEPDILRIPISKDTIIDAELAKRLPMNASRAANLFATGMWLADTFAPWFEEYLTVEPFTHLADGESSILSLAQIDRLLPDETVDEEAQRLWFLEKSQDVMTNSLSDIKWSTFTQATEKPLALEFAHLNISQNITFDAVSFEVVLSSEFMKGKYALPDGTMYNDFVPSSQCGPTPGICLHTKPQYSYRLSYDVPSQVNVLAACLNEDKTDDSIFYNVTRRSADMICNARSNTSLFVISIGKRLIADEIFEDRSDAGLTDTDYPAVVTNLRKIYTYTIGRLAWETTNLSSEYSADCRAAELGCDGLHYELEDGQILIVGANALPLEVLPTPRGIGKSGGYIKLVDVIEPPAHPEAIPYQVTSPDDASDILLPHNINRTQWNSEHVLKGQRCRSWVENRIHNVLNNHYYIEDPLQPSYTAAMFFLFQNAVAKEIILLPDSHKSLKFDNNQKILVLQLRIPTQNMMMTLCGCGLLAVGALAVSFASWRLTRSSNPRSDALLTISSPHVIAQVKLDESKFPPLLFRRRLVDSLDGKDTIIEDVDAFVIRGLSLEHQGNDEEKIMRCFEFQDVPVKSISLVASARSSSSEPHTSGGSTQEEEEAGKT